MTIVGFAGRLLAAVFALSVLLAAGPAAAGDTGVDGFEPLRRQPAIAGSYDLDRLPADAGRGIAVAILATGIDALMQDHFGDRLHAESAVADEPDPFDRNGLGTAVASLVGALAPQAPLISIKVLDRDGQASYEDIAAGIARATALGARIILLPIGTDEPEEDMIRAIAAARKQGALVIAAAGNEGGSRSNFPAAIEGVIAVGAVDDQGAVADFSDRGGKILLAPGVDVTVLGPAGSPAVVSGTSFAAGVAAGILAVLWSQKPDLAAGRLAALVTRSARPLAGGAGRLIDAKAALSALKRTGGT